MTDPTTAVNPAGFEPNIAAVQARHACLDVIDAFFRRVDTGNAARTVDLFTSDGELVLGQTSLSGESLAKAMEVRQNDSDKRGHHVPATSSFRLISDREAEAQTYLHLYRDAEQQPDKPPVARALTLLTDRFVRGDDGRWRIARRQVDIIAGGE